MNSNGSASKCAPRRRMPPPRPQDPAPALRYGRYRSDATRPGQRLSLARRAKEELSTCQPHDRGRRASRVAPPHQLGSNRLDEPALGGFQVRADHVHVIETPCLVMVHGIPPHSPEQVPESSPSRVAPTSEPPGQAPHLVYGQKGTWPSRAMANLSRRPGGCNTALAPGVRVHGTRGEGARRARPPPPILDNSHPQGHSCSCAARLSTSLVNRLGHLYGRPTWSITAGRGATLRHPWCAHHRTPVAGGLHSCRHDLRSLLDLWDSEKWEAGSASASARRG